MTIKTYVLTFLFCGVTAAGQTSIDLRMQSKNVNFSGAAATTPFKTGSTLPAVCLGGETFFLTSAPPGKNFYGCIATNVWVAQGAGVAPGQPGQVLSNNGVDSEWKSLGGDVSGSPDDIRVERLQNRLVAPTAPADTQLLRWNSSSNQWVPSSETIMSVFGRSGAITPQNGDYSFSHIGGTAAISQGGTGATTPADARANLNAAATVHTHALADISGVTGKQGNGTVLQAFGGGATAAGECAAFDTNGNIVPSGGVCGGSPVGVSGDLQINNAGVFAGRGVGDGLTDDGTHLKVANTIPRLSQMNSFTRGNEILGTADEVQLDVRGHSTQTAAIMRVRKNDGTVVFQVDEDGSVSLGSGTGPWTVKNQSAPSTPSSGETSIWTDSTDKLLKTKDDTGNVGTMVRPDSGASNHYLTGISAAGVISKAQPSVSDLSDAAQVVKKDRANTYGAGQKQVFTSDAITAGLNTACAPLPSSPANGDIACDSGDSNKVKVRSNGAWVDPGAGGGGGSSPQSNFVLLSGTATVSSSVTRWSGIGGAVAPAGSSEDTVSIACPVATTFNNLFVKTSSSQDSSGSLVLTFRKNNTNQALTVTIPAGSAAGLFSDTSNSFSCAAGDSIALQWTNNATATSAQVRSFSYATVN